MKRIYLDYASLTPIDKRVMREMKKYSKKEYGNPSALYASGVAAKKALQNAKERIGKILNTHPDEILFTSGGTESNHLVLNAFLGERILTSAIEHSSIMREKNLVRVAVNEKGMVDMEQLKKEITPETKLVSIMLVNNEIGTIEPVHEIVRIAKKINKNILVHTDASQAGLLPLDVQKLGVDFMTLDGGKIYGPRGVGILYVRRGFKIERHGTENLPGIMGFTVALEITQKICEKEYTRISELKKYFLDELQRKNQNIKVNGDLNNSTPHILNVSIPNIDNEFFVLQLDAKGIECSTKSACLYDEDESYVLKSIGADSKTSVRFSFGRETTRSQLKKVIKCVII